MNLLASWHKRFNKISDWLLKLSGRWVLAFFLVGISCLTLFAEWVVLPLNGAIYPLELKWSFFFITIKFPIIFILTLFLGLICLERYGRLSLVMIWGHIFAILAIPANICLYQQDIISAYLEQSKIRLAIIDFTKDYFPLNVNLEPLFEPARSIDGGYDLFLITVSMLDISWYVALLSAFCMLLLAMNSMIKGNYYGFFLGSVMTILILSFNYEKIHDVMNINPRMDKIARYNIHGNSKKALDLCSDILAKNRILSYSKTLMTDCLIAVLKVHGNHHPLASYSNLVWEFKGSSNRNNVEFEQKQEFLFEDKKISDSGVTYKKLQDSAANLNKMLNSDLEKKLVSWLKRTGEEMILQDVKKAISDNRISYAYHQLNTYIQDENLLKNYYLAYILYKKENPVWAEVNFKLMLSKVQSAPIKADLLCGLGDSYRLGADYLTARKIYISCKELDSSSNYWVIKALSGT